MTMKLKPAALATLALLSSLAVGAFADERKTYIVQLKDEPAATYSGGVSGLAATRASETSRFNFQDAPVQDYVRYLDQKQRDVLTLVGSAPLLATYSAVFNGFAASLSEAEVKTLRASTEVLDIFEDTARELTTVSTPDFLGLTAPGGLWSQSVNGSALKGEGLIVGIVDGGIWPENPSFADRVDANGTPTFDPAGTQVYGPAPAGFTGGCMAGEGFDPAKHCNNKLIGAKFYNAGFLASGQSNNWSDFASPRDSNVGTHLGTGGHGGHGDHTASTAAGNSGVAASINGVPMGKTSGMAPRARVAAYKVCWTYDDPTATDGTGSKNSCFGADSVKAIDDAVKDGVHAINFSISGSQTTVNDPVEQAFYRASLAGVFVAASAGNSGPANQVAHISPWLTTVAASTHDRNFQADVLLGNSVKYSGASTNTTTLPVLPLIRAEDAAIGAAAATLCTSNPVVLDPVKVAGKIVICTRGGNARVDKSLAVLNAGGLGMVMVDNGGGLVAEAHSVPTVHVTAADGAAIKSYALAQGSGASAVLSAFYVGKKPAPIMAGFSSRGPNMGDANILKPDLTAPGVDVIAAVTPELSAANHAAVVAGSLVPPAAYASYQGTSMSSPHVAGLSLLLKQAHPDWSPAAIKSALMTTAYSTLDDGLSGAQNGMLPWSQGAGHVDPNKASNPGLVYDAGKADYVSYQCKVNRAAMTAADCSTYGTLGETYNLNLPSITVSSVQGATTVTRRVTNVGDSTATYTATAAVPGFTTVVAPTSLTLAPGQTKSFTVKLTALAATPEGDWKFGALSWTDGSHVVRIPVQARVGKAIAAPTDLSGNTQSGTRLFTVKTGYSGSISAVKGGLKDVTLSAPVTLTPQATTSAQLATACAAGVDTASVKVHNVVVPAGTIAARFALRDQDTSNPGLDDFDMMIVKSDGSNSVYSGNDGSKEAVQLSSPSAGNYKVCVVSFGSPVATPSYMLSSWIVTAADVGGKLTVAVPSKVVAGNNSTVGLSWSGLALGARTLGGVQFKDAAGVVQATTVVRVEANGGMPLAEPAPSTAAKMGGVKP